MPDDDLAATMREVTGLPVKSAKVMPPRPGQDVWIDGVKMISGGRIEMELDLDDEDG